MNHWMRWLGGTCWRKHSLPYNPLELNMGKWRGGSRSLWDGYLGGIEEIPFFPITASCPPCPHRGVGSSVLWCPSHLNTTIGSMTKQSWRVWLLIGQEPWGRPLGGVNMAGKICTPEEPSISIEQPNISMEQSAPKTKRKKEKKSPCQPKTRGSGKVRWSYLCSSSPQVSPSPLPYPCLTQTPSSTHIPTHEASFLSISHPLSHPKQMPCWLTLLPFQVQKKTTKAKRSLQRNLRKKTPQSSPSCSGIRNAAIRPMIFICYHKLNEAHNENEQSGNMGHWKMQPSQVTSCAASKCRAWARNLELAAASSEAAVENWSDI